MKTTYLNRSPLSSTFLLAILFSLSACGGGGGDSTPLANNAPVADAGIDQAVDEGAIVILDGTASADADGDSLAYAWTQVDGPSVALQQGSSETASFTAPATPGGTSLEFKLSVSDGSAQSSDSVVINVADITPPTAAVSPVDGLLGKSETIVVTFSEAMDPDSLVLDGSISSEVTPAWSEGNSILSLSPTTADGEWISGAGKTLAVSAEDAVGNATDTLNSTFVVNLVFSQFQSAERVFGQGDFISGEENRGGSTAADTLSFPYGSVALAGGQLYIGDSENNRVLGFNGIPATNGEDADFVLGQALMTTSTGGSSVSTMSLPISISSNGDKFLVADSDNNRVLLFNSLPTDGSSTPDIVLGQPDKDSNSSGCSNVGLNSPTSAMFVGEKLLVVDNTNHRVLIWNSIPTTDGVAANTVLGQATMDSCLRNRDGGGTASASTMFDPTDAWSNGERLIVTDRSNNRALLWTSFPSSDGTAAAIVIGQADLDSNAALAATSQSLRKPSAVDSTGQQVMIADASHHRIMIWDSFPTEDNPAADQVLGQFDFVLGAQNDTDHDGSANAAPSAAVMGFPSGLHIADDQVFVTDSENNRVEMFRSN